MTCWLLGSGVSVGSVKDRTVVVVMLQELYTCSGGRLFVAKIQHLWIAACQLLNHIHLAIAVLVLSCLQIRVLLVVMPLLAAISQQRWKNLRGGGVISLTMEARIKKKKTCPLPPFLLRLPSRSPVRTRWAKQYGPLCVSECASCKAHCQTLRRSSRSLGKQPLTS